MDPVSAPPPGGAKLLRLPGRDALAVLNRLSTNALLDLEPAQARRTLFCDFRGRLLFRATVVREGDGEVWLGGDGPGGELAAYIERHVFREDVRIEDVNAAAWALDTPEPPRADLEGERRRIGSGTPRHGHEIRDEFNPFEVGLHHEVHLAKGCYTGQEALMRLVTYNSVRRGLTRFEGAGGPPVVPADVTLAGEPVGRLTSSVADGSGGWLGLAVLRPDACAEPGSLEIAGRRDVRVAEPFPVGRPLGLP
jgi:folate-binding protein YgfZ